MFCPKCGSILMPKRDASKKMLVCSCGYRTGDVEQARIKETIPRPEKEVEVVVWRQGQETTLKVTLGELDETETAALAPADEIVPEGVEGEVGLLGLSLAEMSAEMRQRFELGEETSGVVITAVDEGGSAAEKGLRPGDVIVEVDQQAVVKPRDVDEKVNEAKANGYRVVTLLVYREGDFQWVALRIDQS